MEMNIEDYIILYAEYAEALTQKVKNMNKEGWIPLGGVSFMQTDHSYDMQYSQAMIKVRNNNQQENAK